MKVKSALEEALCEIYGLVDHIRDRPDFLAEFEKAAEIIVRALKKGRKIFVAGNGGSAADAQHFVAELVCTFSRKRKGYPAFALTTNTSVLTAWSNDYDFSLIFFRQIEACGKSGDVFVGISTSGNSSNIINGMVAAQEKKMKIILLLGCNGGGASQMEHDAAMVVPSGRVPRIQEIHEIILHSLCAVIDTKLS